MRVLIFTQYFPPEIGATQTRLHTFAAGLAERGHDVEVICEVPNHPQGIVKEGYGGRLVDRRNLEGFRVKYVWVRTAREKTTRTRLAFYASYMGMAAVVGSRVERPDVVFASSPPLPVAVAAAVASRRQRVPWVMDVRDLWPEAAVAMGELRGRRSVRSAERLALWLYRDATAITTVTEPFKEAISAKVENDHKVVVVPNGTTRLWLDAANSEPNRDSVGLSNDHFIWTFAGNVGKAQGLESAVTAAGLLDDEFQFLVLGEGPARPELEQRARSLRPGAVIFRDQVEPALAARHLRASDALLVSLAADPMLDGFVPSKLYDCCAAGRPVLVAAAGEPARLVAEAGAALPVAPGDAEALAAALSRLRTDSRLRAKLSAAARVFAAQHERGRQIETLEHVLQRAARARGARDPSLRQLGRPHRAPPDRARTNAYER